METYGLVFPVVAKALIFFQIFIIQTAVATKKKILTAFFVVWTKLSTRINFHKYIAKPRVICARKQGTTLRGRGGGETVKTTKILRKPIVIT